MTKSTILVLCLMVCILLTHSIIQTNAITNDERSNLLSVTEMSPAGLDYVKQKIFNGKIKDDQIKTINTLLSDAKTYKVTNIYQIAYILATAWHETGTMVPNQEAWWLSEEWRMKNLSYAPYWGRGLCHLTHLANYQKFAKILDIDIVKYPEKAIELPIASKIAVMGMRDGLFTHPSKNLSIIQSPNDYVAARAIINGTDKAELIAGYAKLFEEALRK